MKYLGKFKILKTFVTACDYGFILKKIADNQRARRSLFIAPLASQTLVRAFFNNSLKITLENFDFNVPDSFWVRNSLNFLHGIDTQESVEGTKLMLEVCKLAQEKKYKVYLYGNTQKTLDRLAKKLEDIFPNIIVCGYSPSKFKPLTFEEKKELVEEIYRIKANIIFIGLGSPLQELFAYDLFGSPKTKLTVITAGASFDFIAGVKARTPEWLRNLGLGALFRIIFEPGRLWMRYFILGPLFIFLVLMQKAKLKIN